MKSVLQPIVGKRIDPSLARNYTSIYDIPQFYMKCNDELFTKHRHTCSEHCLRDGICRARFPRDTVSSSYVDEKGHFHLAQRNCDTNRPTAIISYCTGANNDCTHLQSGTSCKGVITYCTDYSSKSPLKMQTTFDTIKAVVTNNMKESDDTDQQVLGKKLLMKMCNSLTVKMEMGGPLVAHYLLGGNGYYTNIKFKDLYWTTYIKHINEIESVIVAMESNESDNEKQYCLINDEVEQAIGDTYVEVLLDPNKEIVTVPVVSTYTMRGEAMNDINLFDFFSSYEVKPFKTGNTSELFIFLLDNQTKRSSVYSYGQNYQERPIRFKKSYPKYGIEAIFKTTERLVINLTGGKLPQHGTEDYYQLVCVLFIPWRNYSHFNHASTWENLYHTANIYQKHGIYLRHWNMLNECYDERDDVHKQRLLLLKTMKDDFNPSQDISILLADVLDGDSVESILGSKQLEQQLHKLSQNEIQESLDSIGYCKLTNKDNHIFPINGIRCHY